MSREEELAEVLGALPHGSAFRFVDELTALSPGHQGSGHYRVRGDEGVLQGHFPGNPILPGVILIEAIAQLGGVVAQSDPEWQPLADLRVSAVRAAKVLGAARPGDTLELWAEVEGRMGGLVQINGRVSRGEEVLATAIVVLSGQDGPDPT